MTVALVLGGADCLWDDIEEALNLGEFSHVVACNDAAAAWPGKLDAAVSLHGEKMGLWMARRTAQGLPRPDRILGHVEASSNRLPACLDGLIDYRLPGQTASGSSGLFALKVALIDLGCAKAVLCGIPMTAERRHFFDARDWRGARAHRRGWEQTFDVIKDRTRSMSGWTAERLGKPDAAWLSS